MVPGAVLREQVRQLPLEEGMSDGVAAIDALVGRLAKAGWKERDAIKDELTELCRGLDQAVALGRLDELKKDLVLEVRWELDEVIERLTPPPAPPEEPEEEPDDPNKPLTGADLNLVYDDPRGLVLHKSKKGERWFATQRDPRTGQPQTFELHPQEIAQLKQQLAGSPYWVLGAGAVG